MDLGQLAGMFGPVNMLSAYNSIENSRTATQEAIAKVEQSKALAKQYLAQAGAMEQQTRDNASVSHLLPAMKQAGIQKDLAAAEKDRASAKETGMKMLPQKLAEGLALVQALGPVQEAARGGDMAPAKNYLANLDNFVVGMAEDGMIDQSTAAAILSKKGGAKIAAFKQLHQSAWQNAPDYLKDSALQNARLAHDSRENALNRANQITTAKIGAAAQKPPNSLGEALTAAYLAGDMTAVDKILGIVGKQEGVKADAQADAKTRNFINTIDEFHKRSRQQPDTQVKPGKYTAPDGTEFNVVK